MRRAGGYREILKSSALIGGSSALNIVFGMLRTKALALLLGPAGYGMMSTYALVVDMSRTIAQLGINASGVRQIADAAASGDSQAIARTVTVLRWVSLACALAGGIVLALAAEPVSRLSFSTPAHAGSVAWLSVAVFFSVVAGGQGALLQGLRHIADMARIAVLSGLLGLVLGVPLVYLYGVDGVVASIIAASACSLATSWWYSRRLAIAPAPLEFDGFAKESLALLKLGMAFLASGLLTMGASYAVRIIVLRHDGLAAAGVYYAAWTLGGLYIGFVLQSLSMDFYPRLVGACSNDEDCNRLVNEQALVSLLLAVPGVVATIAFAPLAISIFYSAGFGDAVDVLRWICLGMALRVFTWPIGFIIVAKNRQSLFFATEVSWTAVNVGLTWWLVSTLGVVGAGIAFFGSYIFHGVFVYGIVRRVSGFRWTASNLKMAACSFALVALVFIVCRLLPPVAALAFGLVATLVSGYVSLRILVQLTSPQRLPKALTKLLQFGRFSKRVRPSES